MSLPLVSVVIPVYNLAHKIRASMDSVLSQGYKNIEIILVNDGSKDDSLAVCEEYARKDPRVKVISQANAGPGAARNAGMKVFKGKYVCFVDSDDLMTDGALKRMLDMVAKDDSDLLIAHFNILMNNQSYDRGYIKEDRLLNRKEFLHELSHRPGSYYYSALWNKLYVGDIIRKHHLFFDDTYAWGEDFEFNMRYYHYVNSVSFLKDAVYNYKRTYSGQTWRTMFEFGDSIKIKARLYKALKSLYHKAGLLTRYRFYIYRYIFNVTIST